MMIDLDAIRFSFLALLSGLVLVQGRLLGGLKDLLSRLLACEERREDSNTHKLMCKKQCGS